ncbi:glycosyltransferase family A protein [Seleniivibrio woodruffii]|uniref:glycosyltransferase family A protein n=1 Tax=Seleniivibrio woodruffii TaxID=1078050 RepID=UPI002409185D|nr:glycosyltransferase family A protein [Seleniivibrio woodruffii]
METLKADILISAYGSVYFEKCLSSALSQRTAARVIVCDNSPDDTVREISEKYACPRLICFRPEEPLTLHESCLRLAESSTAQWVRFLQDCEILAENSLEKRLEQAETFGGISMTFSAYTSITPDGKRHRIYYDLPEFVKGEDYLFNIFEETPLKRFTNILIKKDIILSSLFRELSPFSEWVPAAAAMIAMTEGDLVYSSETMVTRYETQPEKTPEPEMLLDEAESMMNVLTYIESATSARKAARRLKKELMAEIIRENTVSLIKEKRWSDIRNYIFGALQINKKAVLGTVFHISVLGLFARAAARAVKNLRSVSK